MKYWDMTASTLSGHPVVGVLWTVGGVYSTEQEEAWKIADDLAIVELGERLNQSSFVLTEAPDLQPRSVQKIWRE